MIPYGRQSISEEDIAAVVDVLRGDWLTQGPTIDRFEESVAEYVGARFAVAFSSGTAALHGAAAAAGLGPGDVAVTSPLTFMASANCARYVGAEPTVVVDAVPGGGRVVEVALHHLRTADPQLAVGVDAAIVSFEVDDAALGVGDGDAAGAGAALTTDGGVGVRRQLGHAVPLDHRAAEASFGFLAELVVKKVDGSGGYGMLVGPTSKAEVTGKVIVTSKKTVSEQPGSSPSRLMDTGLSDRPRGRSKSTSRNGGGSPRNDA